MEEFLKEFAAQVQTTEPKVNDAVAPLAETEQKNEESVQETIQESAPESVETTSEQPSKDWWEDEDSDVQTAPKSEKRVEEPVVEKQEPLDPDLELLMEYKKSGKSLADFVKEYSVEDYKSWGEDKLVKEGLKEFYGITEEDMESAFYEFQNSSIFQKKQLLEGFMQKFEEKNANKLKELTSTNTQQQEQAKAVYEKYNQELSDYGQQVANKELYGLKITDEMSQNLIKYINDEFTLTRPDGTFDIEKVYSVALWLKHGKDLVKANITKAKNEGREQVIREVSNPSKNNTYGGRSVGSGLEAAQEAFNALFQS